MTTPGHLDAESIAALAEGKGAAPDRRGAVQHLSECDACMAAYADAVRARAGWLANPEGFRAPDEMVRLAIEAGRRPDGPPSLPNDVAPSAGTWRRGPALSWGVGLAAALAVAVIWTGWWPRGSATRIPEAVARGLESCATGGLVLPGGEAGAAREVPAIRSGTPDSVPGLADAVSRLHSGYESGRRDAGSAYALAGGLLALGQMDAARGYIEEARRSAPRDFGLCVLAADIAYRSSDLVTAERELRTALELKPNDPIARLDLGLVLAERGERMAAAALFDRLERDAAGPIRERAIRERAALGP